LIKMASKLRLIILGAPGSGKGTISSRIVKEFRLAHLSSGDLIRLNIERKTEIGLKARDAVAHGQLLPDNFITRIVLQELSKLSAGGWLLDGFPRTLAQCRSLESSSVHVDRVVNLNVPFDVIIDRIKKRWVHPTSGRVYNLEFNPPKVAGKDDITGEPLIQRPDDRPEVVLKRLKEYEIMSKPVIEYYSSKNILATFTGNTSDYLWPLIRTDLNNFVSNQGSNSAVSTAEKLEPSADVITHTGQQFAPDDYRRVRFQSFEKLVNKNVALELKEQDPVVVCDQRIVWSHSGGALGHPKVYINLDKPEIHECGYSGRRFIRKKYYDEATHGKSITFAQYLEDMSRREAEA